ncbi:hypothetical protein GCM10010219_37720 [Streptomyces netropsis]|nr:hypothetical protein GCM10010219_37720 [Streptomyces netropsis]
MSRGIVIEYLPVGSLILPILPAILLAAPPRPAETVTDALVPMPGPALRVRALGEEREPGGACTYFGQVPAASVGGGQWSFGAVTGTNPPTA